MKLHNDAAPVETIGGKVVEQEFKIRASAASFAILSSGLYSNKILAIVRELSCNAYDAHKAAGKADIPFDIHLPTGLSPFFTIKDFGVGLTHEQVLNTYTTYFESTKDDSDDYIGQLGLGSKSPFSYTSAFTVVSRHNGVANSYSMFINDNGIPAVAHLGSENTDEQNGLTITVAVNSTDFYAFRIAAEKALSYFNPYPNVIGDHDARPVKYQVTKERWAMRVGNRESAGVIQGFVRYPVDSSQLASYSKDGLELTAEARQLLDSPIDFIVPIGLVRVAPSREHLSYDARTIKNLVTFINEVAEEVPNALQEIIDGAGSMWDARIVLNELIDYSSSFKTMTEKRINSNTPFLYNGAPVYRGIPITPLTFSGYIITTMRRTSRGYGSRVETHKIDVTTKQSAFNSLSYIPVSSATSVIVNDNYTSCARVRAYVAKMDKGSRVIEIKSTNKKTPIPQTTIDEILNTFGIDASRVMLTSDLVASGAIDAAPVKTATAAPVVDRTKVDVFETGISHSYYCWEKKSVDFSKGGYYVKTYRKQWVVDHTNGQEKGHLVSTIQFLMAEGVIDKSAIIVSATSKLMPKINKNPGKWVNITDVFENYVKANAKKIASRVNAYSFNSHMCSNYIIDRNKKAILSRIKYPDTSVAYSMISPLVNKKKEPENVDSGFLTGYNCYKFEDKSVTADLKAALHLTNPLHEFYKHYPLFDQGRYGMITAEMLTAYIDYINLVDFVARVKTEEQQDVAVA